MAAEQNQTNIAFTLLYKKLTIKFLIFILFFIWSGMLSGQVKNDSDTLQNGTDEIVTNPPDTLPENGNITLVDTALKNKKDESDIKSPIKYSAKDSMMFSVKTKMIYSYGEAKLSMDDMALEAGHIQLNMDSNYVYANSLKDKDGKAVGEPVFKQGSDEYKEKALKYNLKTKKGIVYDVITEQGGGFLHARITKMHPNKEIHLADGKFTTCDAEHPHFYMHLTKGKVIPDKRIISGPFYFVLVDIPIPIGLPFGWFPVRKNRTAGIITPTITETKLKGFGLERGGYYLPLTDYMDMTIIGELWTSGSWGLNLTSNYKKKYKYGGSFDIAYNELKSEDQPTETNFWIKANYRRDPKASPSSTFSASLDFGSSKYRQYESTIADVFADNTTKSSIAYTKTFPNFYLSANMGAIQNLTKHSINLDLPTLTFNLTKDLKPFERKVSSGKKSWYEEIRIGYKSELSNSLDIGDSLLFKKEALEKMSTGFRYNVPISTSLKIFKHINVTPNFNYTGRVYTKSLEQNYHPLVMDGEDTISTAGIRTDTISDLCHVFDFNTGLSLSTKIYGIKKFEKGKISAIRHVMSPTIGFSYRPDFGDKKWKYYTLDITDTTNTELFSKYFGNYGVPSIGKSGAITFGLGNNLEMKVHSKDTAEKFKKIVLLQSLSFNSSYNLMADSLKLAPMSIRASTKLFKQIDVSYGSSLEFYTVDTLGQRQNKTYLKEYGKLGRFTNHTLTLSGSIGSDTFKKKKEKENTEQEEEEVDEYDFGQEDLYQNNRTEKEKPKEEDERKEDADGYSFSVPWNIGINYSFTNSRNAFNKATQEFTIKNQQTLSLNGNVSLTAKWQITGSMSFDLEEKQLVNTNWSISRDLHCWTMSFSFTPNRTYQYYSFRISVKPGMFSGLEYKKQTSWQDNF